MRVLSNSCSEPEYQQYKTDIEEIVAGTALAGVIAQAASLAVSISEFVESLGGELILAIP